MNIKEKAILVSLSVSVWTNAARDEDVVNGLMKRTQTDSDVHTYKKRLIKPEMIAPVKAARLALRTHWIKHTMPWGNGGVRVLPSTKFKTFTEEMRALRSDYEKAATDFCRNYPKMKAEARQRLKSLFKEEDFPSIEDIKSKFGMNLEYAPIPDADDFRIAISDEERKRLKREIEEQVKRHTQEAMASLVERMRETMAILAERMKETDPTIRRSLIDNIKEVCDEVGELNLVGDKQIEALRKSALEITKNVDVEKLKEDAKARKQVASAADDILSKMAAYIGE